MNGHYISAGFPGRVGTTPPVSAASAADCMRFAINLVYAAEKPSATALMKTLFRHE
jgi:hypothetical protein